MSTFKTPEILVIKGIITNVNHVVSAKRKFVQLLVERGEDHTWIVNTSDALLNGAMEGSSVAIQCEVRMQNETGFFDKTRQEFVAHDASGLSATNIIVKAGGDPSYQREAMLEEVSAN